MTEQCASSAAHRSAGAAIDLRCVERGGQTCLVVRGAPSGAQLEFLPTELVGRAQGLQPVAGRFGEQDRAIWFHPRFPLVGGSRYSLLIDGVEVASVEVPPAEAGSTTDVVSIHPTAEDVPFNLLRVYVWFSAPMSEGMASRAVYVRREDTGEKLQDVFLAMEPELWDSSRQRLTLLLEPGRIKRGLGPNREVGYPLTEGVPVCVVVDQSFLDSEGRMLRGPAERRYLIGPAIRKRVEPFAWRLVVPAAQSDSEFVVVLDRPLDRALLRRFLTVVDRTTAPVAGVTSIDEHDGVWRFTPSAPWQAGPYALRVDSRIEDLAGNSVRRPFDRDLELPDNEPLEMDQVELPFNIS